MSSASQAVVRLLLTPLLLLLLLLLSMVVMLVAGLGPGQAHRCGCSGVVMYRMPVWCGGDCRVTHAWQTCREQHGNGAA